MNKYIFFCLLLIANTGYTLNIDPEGVGVRNRVAVVEATVQESPAQITIHFLDYDDNKSYEIYRRSLHSNNWGSKIATIPANRQSWTDTNVSVGDVYEYQIRKKHGNRDAIGYIAAGIRYDQTNYRGRMILLIDNTIITPLSTEIEQLKTDLVGDGWFVETIEAERVEGWNGGQAVTVVKQQIVNVYNAAPANDKPKLLFILGHVPVARSGLDMETSDNHSENEGANATDAYYADIDGIWTDTGTHTSPNMDEGEDPNETTFADSNHINIPGDYKWDQNYIPSELELAFGRVDFADLAKPAAPEIELYKRYLNKLHKYRHVANGYDVGRKIAIRPQGYEESLDMSYRNGVPIVGSTDIVVQNYGNWGTQTGHANWVNNNGPFLAYFQNLWKPEINAIDQQGGLNALLYSSDKSYWGLWGKETAEVRDTNDDWNSYGLSRAVLATGGLNLIVLWGTSPAIGIFFQTAIGETVGYSVKRSMDHHNSKFNIFEYHGSAQGYGIYPDEHSFLRHTKVPHAHFNGDPSIRFFPVKPTSNLVTTSNNNSVSLTWNASSDNNIIGYHVYRSNEKLGQYTKLTTTPVTTTSYTDNNPLVGDNWYMLRAIKLDTTGSGSFLNPSQGIFATAVIDDGTPPSTTVAPASNLVASVNNTVSLTWNASPDNEVTGYEVYHSSIESGNYTKLTTAAISTTSYTDNNPLIGNNFYVVVAIKPDTNGNTLSSDGIFVQAVIQATPPEPASNLVANIINNNTVSLTWNASPDNNITGYNVYVSSTEFGEYTKLTTAPVTTTSYTDNYPITGDNWYKVTAIKSDTNGNTLSSEAIFVKAVIETTPSSTVTIDFEDLPLGIVGTEGATNQYDDAKGFTFRDDLNDILHIYGTADDYPSKVLHPNNWYRQIFLTRTNGKSFDLKSFQYAADIWGDLVEATVTGYLTSGGTISQTYTISSWNMQTLNLNWENLSSVKIDFATGINGNYGALDNFVLVAK